VFGVVVGNWEFSIVAPTFIYFDMGNVLVNFSHDIAQHRLAELTGASLATVNEEVFGSDGLQWQLERGDLGEDDFFASVTALCEHAKTPSLKDISVACSDIFTLNTEIVPLVAGLQQGGHRVGVFSNTCRWHIDWIRARFRLLTMFDCFAMSHEIGAMKPEPASYEKAAEIAGAEPAEIFFTDDREENIQGATKAGFQTMQFTNASELGQRLRSLGLRFNY